MALLSPEASEALASFISSHAVVAERFSKNTLGHLHNQGLEELAVQGPSLMKTLLETQNISANVHRGNGLAGRWKEHPGFNGWKKTAKEMLDEAYQLALEPGTMKATEHTRSEIETDMFLQIESRQGASPTALNPTSEMLDWIDRTARQIAKVMMSYRSTKSIRNDPDKDIPLLVSVATSATRHVLNNLFHLSHAEDVKKGSMRVFEMMERMRQAIYEILCEKIIGGEANSSAYSGALREKVRRIPFVTINRADRISSYEHDRNDKAWLVALKSWIISVSADIKHALRPALDAYEHRRRLPQLAEALRSIGAVSGVDEGKFFLPLGDMIYSEILPAGNRVFLAGNGGLDTTTIATTMNDVDPFLETPLLPAPFSLACRMNLSRSVSVSIHEQKAICPGDPSSFLRPVPANDPHVPILLNADNALRGRINEYWIREPLLMLLASKASPLIIFREQETFLICCSKAGKSDVHAMFPDAQEADPSDLKAEQHLRIAGEQLEDLCAIRIPLGRLESSVSIKETAVPDTNGTTVAIDEKHPLRRRFPKKFPGYRTYRNVLEKLGVRFSPGHGSHENLRFGEAGFSTHSYPFRTKNRSGLAVGYIQTELAQLRIDEEKFIRVYDNAPEENEDKREI
ncbi:hypothetical protein HY213_01190 [Candidatus Peregrinibacteria bacterium]|nr:hypothetical protein [Candidatus Peregrinibacteria bacterium]